jgi:hypothetical protein
MTRRGICGDDGTIGCRRVDYACIWLLLGARYCYYYFRRDTVVDEMV